MQAWDLALLVYTSLEHLQCMSVDYHRLINFFVVVTVRVVEPTAGRDVLL